MSPGDVLRVQRMYLCTPGNSNVDMGRADDGGLLTNEKKNETELNNSTTSDDEDDMMLTKEQFDALYSVKSVKRNGLADHFSHWPSGVLTYQIDESAFSKFC